ALPKRRVSTFQALGRASEGSGSPSQAFGDRPQRFGKTPAGITRPAFLVLGGEPGFPEPGHILYACEVMKTMTSPSRPLRSRRSVLVAAAVASFLLLSCQEGAAGPKAGKKIDFQLKTVDGRALGPKDFPGQVVVVDFWATWGGPCHLQAEIL